MKVGNLVKLLGSPWLGLGVVTDLHVGNDTVYVYFPTADNRSFFMYGIEIHQDRLELICK